MNKTRPVNLDLRTIRFPITAIVSILHRLSGVFLFVLIPLVIWAFAVSLHSPEGYNSLSECMDSVWMKFISWLAFSGLAYHVIAGIRHLLMDVGVGESKKGSKHGSVFVLVIVAIAVIMMGIWIWT